MVMYSRMTAIASALLPHAVAQVQYARPVQGTEQFELDMAGRNVLEQPMALPEQHRDQVELQLVKDAGGKRQLSRDGPVDEYVLLAGRVLGQVHRALDVAHVSHRGPLQPGVGLMAGQDEDRHAVVVVTAPAAGELEGQ